MKKLVMIGGILIGLFGVAAPMLAGQQQTAQGTKQKVTKYDRSVAAHASVQYKGAPQFASIEGTTISYATNSLQEVVHIGVTFYLNIQDVWIASSNPQGPWIPVGYLPAPVPAIICTQVTSSPVNPYQICALPWSAGLTSSVWEPS